MKYSVLIATYNRSAELACTLDSLAAIRCRDSWEVVVVDNNSTDRTREVVAEAAARGPAPIRYVFEREQGKAAALNAAMAVASGEIFAFTDDDALVQPDWLDQAGRALDETGGVYVGGRVLPRWETRRPKWLPEGRIGWMWGVIALLDYGMERRTFGRGIGWPLGVNMAVRASAFGDQRLWWDNRYDRVGNTLRGQGQREWCLRVRASGGEGYYIPDMVVHHLVPADRLTKSYFRRWSYWYGISRAILYNHHGLDMEKPELQTLDFATVKHIAGVPRYMYRNALSHGHSFGRFTLKRQPALAFEQELWLWFFAGVIRQRWKDRQRQTGSPTSLAQPQAQP